ncbi:MAG: low-specificity L-threonine aldolase, partial [Dehalococcoidia bacterium]
MEIIDLRSDTVTQPTPEMRRAMFEAAVGDDVFGDDPTVNELERRAAERLGKEAALFVASGTMGNITAILTHAQRGDEVIVGSEAHILLAEVGGAGALAGAVLRPVVNDARGRLDPAAVETTIRGQNVHFPRTALVCVENTHNRCGGAALTAADTATIADVAHRHGVAVHLDGARVFNAAVALGVPAKELAAPVDSVTFCLSKGLSAPAGSLLCGSQEFIERARRNRKMLGGGMRQVGILAAAGLVALDQMIERLAEDHENAALLARGLAELPGIEIDPESVETNILFLTTAAEPAPNFAERLREAGVLAGASGPRSVRMVTHHGIERRHIEDAL